MCLMELFREGPGDTTSPKGILKGLKYGTTTSAPQQRIGTFVAVAEASRNCEEGWIEVSDRRKTPKTEGWGQNSQKRVTYSQAGVREK